MADPSTANQPYRSSLSYGMTTDDPFHEQPFQPSFPLHPTVSLPDSVHLEQQNLYSCKPLYEQTQQPPPLKVEEVLVQRHLQAPTYKPVHLPHRKPLPSGVIPPYSFGFEPLLPQDFNAPKVGQTRCYWALLTPKLTFVFLDPVLQLHMGPQAPGMATRCILEMIHPDEVENARKDLSEVLKSKDGSGSVTRVRFLRLSSIRTALGAPREDLAQWKDQERIAFDSQYLAADLVINWVAEGVLLCFIHAIVDLSKQDNDERLKTPWTNWCGTTLMDERHSEGVMRALSNPYLMNSEAVPYNSTAESFGDGGNTFALQQNHLPGSPATTAANSTGSSPPGSQSDPLTTGTDRVFQILQNDESRRPLVTYPPLSEYDASELGSLAVGISMTPYRTTPGSDPRDIHATAKTNCTRRLECGRSLPDRAKGGMKQVGTLYVPHGHIIFACHKMQQSGSPPHDARGEATEFQGNSSQNHHASLLPTSPQQGTFSNFHDENLAHNRTMQSNTNFLGHNYERVKFVETTGSGHENIIAKQEATRPNFGSVGHSLLEQQMSASPNCPSPSETGSYGQLAEAARLQTSFSSPSHIHQTQAQHTSNSDAGDWQEVERHRLRLSTMLPMGPPGQPLSSAGSDSPHAPQTSGPPRAGIEGRQNAMQRSPSDRPAYQENWPLTTSHSWEGSSHSGNSSPAGGIDGQPMVSPADTHTPTSSASSMRARPHGDLSQSYLPCHASSAPPNGLSHFPTAFPPSHNSGSYSRSLGMVPNTAMRSVEDVLSGAYEPSNDVSRLQRSYYMITGLNYSDSAQPRYNEYAYPAPSGHPASAIGHPMVPHLRDPPGTRASGIPPPGVTHCTSCGTDSSPEWRKGDTGIKNLCNACGLRYARSKQKKEGLQPQRRKRKDKSDNVSPRAKKTMKFRHSSEDEGEDTSTQSNGNPPARSEPASAAVTGRHPNAEQTRASRGEPSSDAASFERRFPGVTVNHQYYAMADNQDSVTSYLPPPSMTRNEDYHFPGYH